MIPRPGRSLTSNPLSGALALQLPTSTLRLPALPAHRHAHRLAPLTRIHSRLLALSGLPIYVAAAQLAPLPDGTEEMTSLRSEEASAAQASDELVAYWSRFALSAR